MKIDIFFDAYPHPAKPYFDSQLAEWRRQGHDLRLYSLGGISGAKSPLPVKFIHTLRNRPLPLISRALWRMVRHPRRSIRVLGSTNHTLTKIKRLITDAQLPADEPEINFIHNLCTAVHFAYLSQALPNTRLAIYYHGGEIPGVRQIPEEESSAALRQADIVFSNTRASVSEVIKRGAQENKTACIPVGIAVERFPERKGRSYLTDGCWQFVCLGRMAREKGFDVVLRAIAALKAHRSDFHLTLIGGGPALEALRSLAKTLNLDGQVTFAGYIQSYDEMIQRLAKFDALIFAGQPVPGSNFKDTQACVMQEAMLTGASVIASDIGGIRESLPPFLHKYLYTPGSDTELRDRLLDMMRCNEETLRDAGERARSFVLNHYDIRKVNESLLARLRPIT